ncbi:MAG: hypothetical protein ACI8S3_001207, partial [Alphaproteobacteria bacterium]
VALGHRRLVGVEAHRNRGTVYLINSRQSVAYHPALATWSQFS